MTQKEKIEKALENLEKRKQYNWHKGEQTNSFTLDGIIKTIKEYAKEKNNINIELYSTGSRTYGIASSKSDYDIVIYNNDDVRQTGIVSSSLYYQFGEYETIDSDYNNGKKMVFGEFPDKVINLIYLGINDFCYWKVATDFLTLTARVNGKNLKDKTLRIAAFEQIKAFARIAFGENVTIKTYKNYLKNQFAFFNEINGKVKREEIELEESSP